jgi:hypothetical protein
MNLPLKLGSKGPDVEKLQEALEIKVDGDFGPMTESAVKAFQKAIGLTADGIVGPKTANKLGLLDSDTSVSTNSTGLQFEKLWMDKDEYYAGPTKKEWIFLHHTAGWHNPYNTIKNWNNDDRGKIGTEFVLGGPSIKGTDNQFDGVLVQAFPAGGYAWHNSTGSGPIHTNSVGIEICNFGYVTKGGYRKGRTWVALNPNEFYNYVGSSVVSSQITTLAKPFRGHTTWHRYSDKQIEVLRDWILWVANRDGIDPRKGLVEQIHKLGAHEALDLICVDLAKKTKGIWSHTNITKEKVDIFPQSEMIDMLVSL